MKRLGVMGLGLLAVLLLPLPVLAVPSPPPVQARPELKELQLTLNLAIRVQETVTKGTTQAAYAKLMTLMMPQLDDVLYGMRQKDPDLHRNFKAVKDHYQAAWEVWEAKASKKNLIAGDYLPIYDRLWEEQTRRFPAIRTGVSLANAPGGGKMVYLPDVINWHWRQADHYLDVVRTLVPEQEK